MVMRLGWVGGLVGRRGVYAGWDGVRRTFTIDEGSMASRSCVWGCGVFDVFEGARSGCRGRDRGQVGGTYRPIWVVQVPCSGSTCDFSQLRGIQPPAFNGVDDADFFLVPTSRFDTGPFCFAPDHVKWI